MCGGPTAPVVTTNLSSIATSRASTVQVSSPEAVCWSFCLVVHGYFVFLFVFRIKGRKYLHFVDTEIETVEKTNSTRDELENWLEDLHWNKYTVMLALSLGHSPMTDIHRRPLRCSLADGCIRHMAPNQWWLNGDHCKNWICSSGRERGGSGYKRGVFNKTFTFFLSFFQ